jgi:hypothetical protein
MTIVVHVPQVQAGAGAPRGERSRPCGELDVAAAGTRSDATAQFNIFGFAIAKCAKEYSCDKIL